MVPSFRRIGLIGKHRRGTEMVDTVQALIDHLQQYPIEVLLETDTARPLSDAALPTYSYDELGQHCDLLIVVGGDGNLLNAAPMAVAHDVPILGINRGRLGFLTDIRPNELAKKLDEVLAGDYQEERRFLLGVTLEPEPTHHDTALNDVVLMPGAIPHMIEFSIYIDHIFVSSQRADGLIIATPTGSTAYALSGGGPILHPHLEAVVLVPMFPHTFSSRPIVIDSRSTIHLSFSAQHDTAPRLSCDGRPPIPITAAQTLHIQRQTRALRLIHPMDYHYFATLRDKLHWNTKPA